MSRKYQIFALMMMFAMCMAVLTGCSAFEPKTKVVYETQYIRTQVPEGLLVKVQPPAPMVEETFLSLDDKEQQLYLTDYAMDLMSSVATCNAQLLGVKQYLDKTQGEDLESQSKNKRTPH